MLNALVVDDDINVGLFISRLLEKKFNCKVESVTDGIEALKKLKTFAPDIIFLDVTMPGMDGINTMQAIKASEEFRNIPIVMITAINEKDIVVKAMGMGAIAYILKPLVYLPVYEKIKEIFSKLKSGKNTIDSKTYSNKNFNITKILIVDNDKNFIERIKSRINDDYRILNADNGIDGLVLCNQEKPKFVILSSTIDDINLDLLIDRIKNISSEISILVISEDQKLTSHENKLWDTIIKK